ncbi:hypothetical protein E4U43_000966 [Claviceps pusilla]|uniref:DUF7514 domain-containing protein n=1 Tax=Claviceps pusilla TaxID=123648 RepID=A0A9P7N936_9HYPO|nr:hypothetical protein E4U43_000966 [Claviceps pusilla]
MSSPYPDKTPGAAVQYAYMFEKDKGPTKQFDALLRAIARYVILEIGDKSDRHLTPKKLAAFYKAVGGNYDPLFVDMPHSSISYIWQVTGCQHTLQPTGNDFEAPSIPALTFRGFSRWESLEVLLGPEEHVPFLQYAVKNWNLKHPETGQDFPPDLPVSCFPTQADQEVDRWHKVCAEKLWTAATASSSNDQGSTRKPSPSYDEKPEPRFAYVHVREPFSSTSSPNPQHTEAENFERPSYSHMHRHYTGQRRTERSPDRRRRSIFTDDRGRRRSFSDYGPKPPPDAAEHGSTPRGYSPIYLDPHGPTRSSHARRHSHPRRLSSASSAEEEEQQQQQQQQHHAQDYRDKRHRHPTSPPPPSIRRFARTPGNLASPGAFNGSSSARFEDVKRRNGTGPLGTLRDRLSETVSNILPNGRASERPRSGSRQNSGTRAVGSRRSREQVRPSRLNHSFSDVDTENSEDHVTSEGDARRRRRLRDERTRDRDRDRERDRERERDWYQSGRGRDGWDDDRDSEPKRGSKRYLRRPDTHRRTSSHADIDRQRDPPEWDSRDRERDRDRLRDERRKWGRRYSPEDDLTGPAAAMASRQMHAEAAHG